MNKLLFGLLCVFLTQQDVFSATDEEVQQAYAEFENVTYDVLYSLAADRTNYSEHFLQRIAVERLDGKLELNFRLTELTEQINALTTKAEGYEELNVTLCAEGVIEGLKTVHDSLFAALSTCLLDVRYQIGSNIVSARWANIVHLGLNYLTCSARSVLDCKGNADCNDQIIAEIKLKQEEAPKILKMFGANMLNSLDTFPVRCKEQIFEEFNNRVSDTLEGVATCVDAFVSNLVPFMCELTDPDKKFERFLKLGN